MAQRQLAEYRHAIRYFMAHSLGNSFSAGHNDFDGLEVVRVESYSSRRSSRQALQLTIRSQNALSNSRLGRIFFGGYALQMICGRLLAAAVLLLSTFCSFGSPSSLTPEQQAWVSKAKRFERAGWIYLHVEGEPRARGFQHGCLLAKEIDEGLKLTRQGWEHQSAMQWSWLVDRSTAMLVPKIDPENLAELDGIAEGASAAGVKTSRDEIIAYNAILELSGYWWPTELKKIKDAPIPPATRESCSSFIATGRWTKHGDIVLGHNTMQDYGDVLPQVIQDIKPAKGHRILWQTTAGWIHSGSDFFITDAGLVGSETTIGQFEGFDTNGIPEFTRMRRATQDAANIDA